MEGAATRLVVVSRSSDGDESNAGTTTVVSQRCSGGGDSSVEEELGMFRVGGGSGAAGMMARLREVQQRRHQGQIEDGGKSGTPNGVAEKCRRGWRQQGCQDEVATMVQDVVTKVDRQSWW